MIRFIHAADAHIDSPLKGLEAHDGALIDVLRGATRRAFENLIQLEIDENFDFLELVFRGHNNDFNQIRLSTHTGPPAGVAPSLKRSQFSSGAISRNGHQGGHGKNKTV